MSRSLVRAVVASLGMVAATATTAYVANAQTGESASPQSAPQNAAVQSGGVICKDGTPWPKSGRGACRGHGGVDKARTKAAAAGGAGQTAAPSGEPPAGSAATRGEQAPTRLATAPSAAPAPGGGAGQVWVNTGSKVYHCPGDRWYGKTKHGQYMSEAQAKADGDRPDHGKSCT